MQGVPSADKGADPPERGLAYSLDLVTAGVVAAAVAVASGLGRRPGAPPSRRAAVLGAATGIS
jgi:hypothetical protein